VLPRGLRRGQVNFRSHNSFLSLGASSPGRRRACVLFGVSFRGGYSPTGLPGDTAWLAFPPTGWGWLGVLSQPPVPPLTLVASDVETVKYGRLPDLPGIIGTAAVSGKFYFREDEAAPSKALPTWTPRQFVVTQNMSRTMVKKFSDANLSATRPQMGGAMALLKNLYDIRLPRYGNTTPYEPLFPAVAREVTVD